MWLRLRLRLKLRLRLELGLRHRQLSEHVGSLRAVTRVSVGTVSTMSCIRVGVKSTRVMTC